MQIKSGSMLIPTKVHPKIALMLKDYWLKVSIMQKLRARLSSAAFLVNPYKD
jgi:hypothetical protein